MVPMSLAGWSEPRREVDGLEPTWRDSEEKEGRRDAEALWERMDPSAEKESEKNDFGSTRSSARLWLGEERFAAANAGERKVASKLVVTVVWD